MKRFMEFSVSLLFSVSQPTDTSESQAAKPAPNSWRSRTGEYIAQQAFRQFQSIEPLTQGSVIAVTEAWEIGPHACDAGGIV
jgi:hypothetical protein